MRPEVIQETKDWISVSKPAGMFTIPDREQSAESLKDLLKKRHENLFTVHRLDKDTSGIILFAKNETAHKYFSKLFENREIRKFYIGVVKGVPYAEEGVMDASLAEHPVKKGLMTVSRSGKESATGFKVLEKYPQYSLMEFELFTGRMHQIRVHASNAGFPLAADPLYGDGKPVLMSEVIRKYKLAKKEETEQPVIATTALHAHRLIFTDADGKEYQLEAPIPKSFVALMKQQSKNSS